MTAWNTQPPSQPGEYWWRNTSHALTVKPRIVSARWAAPGGKLVGALLAGEWFGGLEPVASMGGEWQPVERWHDG